MPGPVVVYVAAVVGTTAAVLAFKHFVYDPHIAPAVDAWKDAHRPRRRMETPLQSIGRSGTAPRPKRNPSGSTDDTTVDSSRSRSFDRDDVPIEMDGLVANETQAWGEHRSGLRHRNVRSTNHYVLDEENVFIPFDPMAATPIDTPTNTSPATTVLHSLPSSPPVIRNPLPQTPLNTQALENAAENILRRVPTPMSLGSSSRTQSPATDMSSSTSSFTPAVIGPRSPSPVSRNGSPGSNAGRSTTYDIVSPPLSRAISPASSPSFYRSPARSPFVEVDHPLMTIRSPSPELLFNRSPSPEFISPPTSPDQSMFSPRSDLVDFLQDPFETDSDGSDFSDLSDLSAHEYRIPSPPPF